MSEGHASATRILKLVTPTRALFDLSKPARYVHSSKTDIRATFKKFERLERMKARAE
jgi:hypothetical protein